MADLAIIIPVFNGGELLKKALASFSGQLNLTDEVIIVDDGSTDNAVNQALLAVPLMCRVNVLNQKNQGVASALNAGFKNATSERLVWLSHDDEFLPGALEFFRKFHAAYPKKISCTAFAVGENSAHIKKVYYLKNQLGKNHCLNVLGTGRFFAATISIPKPLYRKMQFDQNLLHCQDSHMWLSTKPEHWEPSDIQTAFHRLHPNQTSKLGNLAAKAEYRALVRNNISELYKITTIIDALNLLRLLKNVI